MLKRIFDIVFSATALLLLSWLLLLLWLFVSADTKSNGFFIQERIGQFGKKFKIFKLKTFHSETHKISRLGMLLRKSKIDELPQLLNVLIGDMSIVGPRPDIPGYYDMLSGEERKILELKPGITSEASIKYSNEEQVLAEQANPLRFNDEIIFPDKVKMNLDYYYKRSFSGDLKIIFNTIFK